MSAVENLFDVHCHLIPGVDDGSKTMEESMEALRLEYEQGVRTVFCTSHYSADCPAEYAGQLLHTFEELKACLRKDEMGKNMKLFLGNELMYTESLIDRLAEHQAWTLAGSHYVLVEFLPTVRYEELYRGLRRLASAGYLPILAHMERYHCLFKQDKRLEELAELDIYLQVNGASLFGGLFDSETFYVRKLCKTGKIHFLGTDSHGIHYRKPDIRRAADWIKNNCRESLAVRMLYDNPQAILDDKII